MPRQRRAAQNRAVEQRTGQRLAARKEATQRGVETRRRNREAREQAQAAPQAAKAQGRRGQVAGGKAGRARRTGAQDKRASGAMVTVALRGEPAQRLRALAAAQEMSLSKLLARMMEVFEAHGAR